MKQLLDHYGLLEAMDAIDEHYKLRDAEKATSPK
jgi:hypothetical protein